MKKITFHYFSNSKLIQMRLGKKFSHVGIELDNGDYIDSRFTGGTAYRTLDVLKVTYSHSIFVEEENYQEVVKFLNEQNGKRYDYLALIGFVKNSLMESPKRWFCSELAYRVFVLATGKHIYNYTLISPSDLRYLVHGYIVGKTS